LSGIVGIGAVVLFYGFTLFNLAMVTPLYLEHMGLGLAAIGLALSLPQIPQILLRVPGGMAVDRWGEKRVLIVSTALLAVSIPMYWTVNVTWVIVAQLVSALSRSLYWPASESYVSKTAGGTLGSRLGVFQTIMGFGNIAGPLLAGWVVARSGYQGNFTLLMAMMGLCVVSTLFLPAIRSAAGPGQPRATRGRVRPSLAYLSKPLVLACTCRYAAGIPMALVASFLPVYLKSRGLPLDVIGVASAFRGVFSMVGSLGFGFAFSRLSRLQVWLIGLVGLGLSLAAIPVSSVPAAVYACMGLSGLAAAPMQILSLAIATDSTEPARRGVGVALVGTAWAVSLVVTPLVFGLFTSIVSAGALFCFGGAILGVLGLSGSPLLRWAYPAGVATATASGIRAAAGQGGTGSADR